MRRYVICALAVLLAISVFGQSPTTKKSSKASSTARNTSGTLRQNQVVRALELLDAIAVGTRDFKDRKAGIAAQAQAADLQWKYDQSRARANFREAFDRIATLDEVDEELTQAAKFQLRNQIVQMVMRHDAAMGRQLADSAFKPGASQPKEQIAMARSVMESDPSLAASLLTSSAQQGIDRSFGETVETLRASKAAAADEVFAQALVANQNNYNGLMELAIYLHNSQYLPGGTPEQQAVDPGMVSLIRTFLPVAHRAIISKFNEVGPGATIPMANVVRLILPMFDQYAPELAPDIRTRLNQLPQPKTGHGIDPPGDELSRKALGEAEASGRDQEKDESYVTAARAKAFEDVDAALFIADNIRNRDTRDSEKTRLRSMGISRALNQGDSDAAYKYAKDQNGSFRVQSFKQIIDFQLGKKRIEQASALLNEIEAWANRDSTMAGDPQTWLSLTETGIGLDPNRGFQLLRSAVKAINATAFRVPGNENKSARLRVDRLNYEPAFTLLARADFEQALSAAQSINNKEAAALAELAVCDGLLNSPVSPKIPPE